MSKAPPEAVTARQLNRTTLLRQSLLATGDEPAPARFLARWDSAIIGYERRDRILPEAVAGDVIRPKNGDFLPSFMVGGYVAGTWSVATTPSEAVLEIAPSVAVPASARTDLTEEGERLVRFMAPEAVRHGVTWALLATVDA